jgi:hypothetical protein
MCESRDTFAARGAQIKYFAGVAEYNGTQVQSEPAKVYAEWFPDRSWGIAHGYGTKHIPIANAVRLGLRLLVTKESNPRPIDRIVEFRKTANPTVCNAKCRSARGPLCDCSCGGQNHGISVAMSREGKESNMKTSSGKAKMAREYVLWGFPPTVAKGETDRLHEKPVAWNMYTPAAVEKAKKEALARGWHGLRVDATELHSRLDKKAKMARSYELVGSRGNKRVYLGGPDGVGKFNLHFVQVSSTGVPGEGAAEDLIEMKQFATEAKARSAAQKMLAARTGAKASMAAPSFANPYATMLRKAIKSLSSAADETRRKPPSPERDRRLKVLEADIDAQKAALKAISARAGAKSAFAHSDIIVRSDAQYDYYYPEDDDRATHADEEKPGVFVVKSNKTGRPVGAKRFPTWETAVAASNAINEKLPPLKRRRMEHARPNKKALNAFDPFNAPALPSNWDGKSITLNGRQYRVVASAGGFDLYDLGSGKKAKTVTKEQLDKAWSGGKIRDVFGRKGAKAAFAVTTYEDAEYRIALAEERIEKIRRALADRESWIRKANRLMDAAERGDEKARSEVMQIANLIDAASRNLPFSRTGAKSKLTCATPAEAEALVRQYLSQGRAAELYEIVRETGYRDPVLERARKNAKISEAILALKAKGVPTAQAIDQVLGAGTTKRMADKVYDAFNASRPGAKSTHAAGDKVSRKIATLTREGYRRDQAVAIAHDMKRRGEI